MAARRASIVGNDYGAGFFEGQLDGSLRSAQAVVPALIDLASPASVLDVGCGVGSWLRAFADAAASTQGGTHHVNERWPSFWIDKVRRARLRLPRHPAADPVAPARGRPRWE